MYRSNTRPRRSDYMSKPSDLARSKSYHSYYTRREWSYSRRLIISARIFVNVACSRMVLWGLVLIVIYFLVYFLQSSGTKLEDRINYGDRIDVITAFHEYVEKSISRLFVVLLVATLTGLGSLGILYRHYNNKILANMRKIAAAENETAKKNSDLQMQKQIVSLQKQEISKKIDELNEMKEENSDMMKQKSKKEAELAAARVELAKAETTIEHLEGAKEKKAELTHLVQGG